MIDLSKLKVGSKVVRIAPSTLRFENGEVYSVTERDGGYRGTVGIGLVSYHKESWKLAEEREMFDMKTQPWFIKINSQEEFDLVKEWLIENYGSGLQCDWDGYFKKCGVTNWTSYEMKVSPNYLMWMGEESKADKYAREIKFNFRKVIDNVELPDVKSEQELEIERLTEIINQAQETLNKMKGGKI